MIIIGGGTTLGYGTPVGALVGTIGDGIDGDGTAGAGEALDGDGTMLGHGMPVGAGEVMVGTTGVMVATGTAHIMVGIIPEIQD